MTHNEFSHNLSSINGLSPDQIRRLFHELESKMAAAKAPGASEPEGDAAEESAFDVARRAGLIGCIKGAPISPADLRTNPQHMERLRAGLTRRWPIPAPW